MHDFITRLPKWMLHINDICLRAYEHPKIACAFLCYSYGFSEECPYCLPRLQRLMAGNRCLVLRKTRLWWVGCGAGGTGSPGPAEPRSGSRRSGQPRVRDGAGGVSAAGHGMQRRFLSCSGHLSLPAWNFLFPNASLSGFLPAKSPRGRASGRCSPGMLADTAPLLREPPTAVGLPTLAPGTALPQGPDPARAAPSRAASGSRGHTEVAEGAATVPYPRAPR